MVLPYAFLFLAIVLEVVGTLFLRDTEGFTKMIPNLVVVFSYAASFYFLSLTFQHISVSVAYAIWSGVGIVGIAVFAVIFHDQQLDAGAILGMGLIIAGIIIMRTYSTMSLE